MMEVSRKTAQQALIPDTRPAHEVSCPWKNLVGVSGPLALSVTGIGRCILFTCAHFT